MSSLDDSIRLAALEWIRKQTEMQGDVFTRSTLQQGFVFQSERIPLVSPQGIFKPKWMEYPLTITTTTKGPYRDTLLEEEGYLIYKYRGTDRNHSDNVGLRECMLRKLPLIYFHSIVVGKYLASWPVYIIGDNPSELSFKVALDDFQSVVYEKNRVSEPDSRRLYLTSTIKVRLQQRSFRERVLLAYRSQCTLCNLRHVELLDAAHIIPYGENNSSSNIENGLSLCKLHHAAFDNSLIGITPDYEVEVRQDILEERDGPMLKHGLKEINKTKIVLPKNKHDWPKKEFLEIRYNQFINFL